MQNYYKVNELSKLSWISIKTLHYYDEIGLMKPSTRSKSGYRYYWEDELYKLQQILFYKELDFSLEDIKMILNNPEFDILSSLEKQKRLLHNKKNNLSKLIKTIDNTILQIKWETMKDHKKLYDWLSIKYRDEAIKKFGKNEVETSEQNLLSMWDDKLESLKQKFSANWMNLYNLKNTDPKSDEVQALVKEHYESIHGFWWKVPVKEAYIWLGQLYIDDDRYTSMDWKPDKEFAVFLRDAIKYFAEKNL